MEMDVGSPTTWEKQQAGKVHSTTTHVAGTYLYVCILSMIPTYLHIYYSYVYPYKHDHGYHKPVPYVCTVRRLVESQPYSTGLLLLAPGASSTPHIAVRPKSALTWAGQSKADTAVYAEPTCRVRALLIWITFLHK